MLTLDEAAYMLFYGACCETCRETRRADLAKLGDQLDQYPRRHLLPVAICLSILR
jgi:hypothetical protein